MASIQSSQVRLNRLLKYLNVLIGLVFLVAIALIYWYAVRPLPKTSGAVSVPVSRPATATRDDLGVPHIKAATVEDALFVQGYVTAQDRLWQMDILRRAAAGELSEVIGARTVDMDREARRLRIRRLAEQHAGALPPADRAYIAAYARGVNHYIETHRDSLPLEFTVLRYDPRPWTIADTLCIGLQMVRDLTSTGKFELSKAGMLAGGETELVNQIFPVRSGAEEAPGSNGWVISGKRSTTGKPILANDPHLQYTFPATWYMAHLQAPDLNVEGVTVPGLPGIVIGHNERIAWGITNLGFDVQDWYQEKMDVNTGRYAHKGAVEQARREHEVILVRGAKNATHDTWVTRHGPVTFVPGMGLMALRWIAAEPGALQYPFVQLNMARDWNDFRTALRRLSAPSSNIVYADVDGNIGYQAIGLLPIRRNHEGDLPTVGDSGQTEWDGFIPFDELPSSYNPASGVIVTANQNPFPPNYPYKVGGEFAPAHRERQIRGLLAKAGSLKPEDMLAIQKDVYSSFAKFIAQQTVTAYDKRKPKDDVLRVSVDLLRNWNGQMEIDGSAPLIATLIYQKLRTAVGNRASNGKSELWESSMAAPVVERLLRERPVQWFRDYDQLLMRCFLEAIEEGRRLQGRNPEAWRYGYSLETTMRHPVFGQADWLKYIPTMGEYFRINIGPVPMSGSSHTVKQTTRRLGPSMRFVADTANWDNSLMNLTLGQSGQVFSRHYSDQWDEYYTGRSFPRPFQKVDGGSTLEFKPQ
ncbi:MAG TPA: penicillin acylase family protein [Bryobacteraceae bacterium]|nr:penicillin acylase family protein [Bryobacteraceae bacterium]